MVFYLLYTLMDNVDGKSLTYCIYIKLEDKYRVKAESHVRHDVDFN